MEEKAAEKELEEARKEEERLAGRRRRGLDRLI